jgi:hypothetical protein
MTTINRATWTDDDGSGMTGTILNNARLQGDIYDKVDGALATLDTKDASQDTAIAANGPHSILSAQHPDTTPAALVAGDLLVVNASGKLVRLPKAADGSLLGIASGVPAWGSGAQWSVFPYAAGNLTAATGTFTTTAGNFFYQYLVVGKLGMINVVVGPATTSAATAYVAIAWPSGFTIAAANINLLGTINTGTLVVTLANASPGGGLRFYPNVAASGTIPATAALYVNASLFFALA